SNTWPPNITATIRSCCRDRHRHPRARRCQPRRPARTVVPDRQRATRPDHLVLMWTRGERSFVVMLPPALPATPAHPVAECICVLALFPLKDLDAEVGVGANSVALDRDVHGHSAEASACVQRTRGRQRTQNCCRG